VVEIYRVSYGKIERIFGSHAGPAASPHGVTRLENSTVVIARARGKPAFLWIDKFHILMLL
jgi:hypothetical protein